MGIKIDMGLGDLCKPTTLWVKKHRFTIKTDNHNLDYVVKGMSINLVKKELEVELYWVVFGKRTPVEKWLADLIALKEKTLTLTNYDGCGNAISEMMFSGVQPINHECSYDMSSSDVAMHKVSIKFDKWENVKEKHEE